MTSVPANPKIYHITHIDNLDEILKDKVLWSDAKRLERGLQCEIIGMPEIKRSRLEECVVKCHPDTMVGEYVPFYFCSRSIMLFILHKGNHPDITYHGGQEPILHLEVDLKAAISWAEANHVRWAYSDINARTRYAQFYNDPKQINNIIHWSDVQATDWRDPKIQEYKQAEFLMYESFPWSLVEKIGVYNSRVRDQVIQKLGNAGILVKVETSWYY
jgi:hypothetical protein